MAQKYVLKVKEQATGSPREDGEQPQKEDPDKLVFFNPRSEVCEHSATTITLIVGGIFVAAVR